MGLFSRRRRTVNDEVEAVEPQTSAEPAELGTGPFDEKDVPELGSRVDLGALRIPRVSGMKIRLELEKRRRTVVGASVALDGSALQLQLFAAPRSAGLWDDVRQELAESVRTQKGIVEEVTGRWGDELVVRLPVTRPDGSTGMNPLRFLGVDGPRWFLRAMVSGLAAQDASAADALYDVLEDVVVCRGPEARAPRDVIPLTAPGSAERSAEVETGGAPQRGTLTLKDLDRGPEITETR